MNYTGRGDSFLDFEGTALDFGTEANLDRVVRVKIINDSDEDQLVILNPSYAPSVAARVLKETIVYETGATDLTATCDPNPIAEFLAFIANNPTSITKLRFQSNNAEQFTKALIFTKRSIGKKSVESRVNLESSVSEYANNDKIITLRNEFTLSNQVELGLTIPANTTTTISFYVGVTLNTAYALDEKKKIALTDPGVAQQKAQVK